MATIDSLIKDLTIFYVKTNYENYLKENNLTSISDNNIKEVVNLIYNKDKQEHLIQFIINSLKELLKDESPTESIIRSMLLGVMDDEEFCKQKLITEIKIYQNKRD
tara:strand:+ start:1430 stop:1747 length:318 start_codon:yes stop_codon:yes gene_type:complete